MILLLLQIEGDASKLCSLIIVHLNRAIPPKRSVIIASHFNKGTAADSVKDIYSVGATGKYGYGQILLPPPQLCCVCSAIGKYPITIYFLQQENKYSFLHGPAAAVAGY